MKFDKYDCGLQMQAAEIAFQREQNELEIARAKELSEIEVSVYQEWWLYC